jgi:membrane-anchored mycosin MYCP
VNAGAAARLGVAVALLVAPCATAGAAPPPPIDAELLPAPGSPRPPQPTEQDQPCYTSSGAEPDGAAAPTTDTHGLDLPAVWRLSRGAGQTVAVIDTGVVRHRLLPRLVGGGDYVSTGDGTQDCDGHGTVVAGIIGAAPSSDESPSGVAPEATILSIRQTSTKFSPAEQPQGSGTGDVTTLAMAVRTAADLGATVINVSSVACLPAGGPLDDRALGAALAYAVDVKNAVVVAAAGNVGGPGQCPEQNPTAGPPDWTGIAAVASPAWYDDYVLTVGSVGADGAASEFSLAGPWVDVAALGEGVVSLDPDGEGLVDTLPGTGDRMPIAGTSYAAPVVSGLVALVRSRWPLLSARQVMQRIEDTARHPSAGWDPRVGNGPVDALAAISGQTGVTPLTNTENIAPPTTSAPLDDSGATTVAFTGTAVCGALVVVALTGAAARSRRRDTVMHD